ncbi:MAG: hypothetical protein JSW55_01960 [Chloroflexota bacterium]|nr:MAG: hypothetical protein JSW55_01960 [Chloroflexota bacterium]
MDTNDIRRALAHVLWLGGGPDAGKSTAARILVRRYGLGFYSLDKRGQTHLERLAAGSGAGSATYREVLDTSPVERLAALAPAAHVDWAWTFAHDRFPLLLEELRSFQGPRPLLAEGAGVLPELVAPLLTSKQQAIWLVPSETFVQANWGRSKKRFLARQMADPARAKRDLLTIDQLLAERIAKQARANSLRALEIDGSESPAEVAELVAEHFEPHLPAAG